MALYRKLRTKKSKKATNYLRRFDRKNRRGGGRRFDTMSLRPQNRVTDFLRKVIERDTEVAPETLDLVDI